MASAQNDKVTKLPNEKLEQVDKMTSLLNGSLIK
jgi:hypothetical protein